MSSIKLTPGKKRVATSTSSAATGPPGAAKRQKRLVDDTGRISTAAVLAEQSGSSASSYLSIRERPVSSDRARQVRSLTSLALGVVGESFDTLFLDENGQIRHGDEGTQASIAWLRLLSPRIANRLLELLLERYAETLSDGSGASGSKSSSSTRITVAALSSLFLHPSSSSITHFELPQSFFRAAQKQYDPSQRLENDPENVLTESTFTSGGKGDSSGQTEALKQKALARAARDRSNLLTSLARCTTLRSVSLAGQANLQDAACAELVKSLAQLEELSLKGCTEVGDQTVIALARQSGKKGTLRVLNLNYTAVTVKGLKSLFARCKTLEVLKLANVNGLNDANVQALVDSTSYMAADWLVSPLARLQTLKLRSTKIGDHGLRALLSTCTSLSSLDISYTQVRSLDTVADLMVSHASVSMEKLVLSGLSLRTQTALQKFFKAIAGQVPDERRASLHTLKLGTLDLLDAVLAQIVPHLQHFAGLRKVSLFSNDKLGLGSGTGLRIFLERIAARRLRVLDLSHVPLGGRKLNSLLLDDIDSEGEAELESESAGEEVREKGGSRLRTLILNRAQVDDEACLAISTLRNLEELHLEQGRVSTEGMKLVMEGCSRLRVLDLTGCRGIPTKQRRDWFDAYARGEVGRKD